MTEITAAKRSLSLYGYAVLESLLTPEEVASTRARVEQLHGETAGVRYEGVPQRDAEDKILYNLQNKDRRFIALLGNSAIESILREYLNDPFYRYLPAEANNYILSYYNARSSGKYLDLHIDSHIPAPGDRTWAMQLVFVLDDFREANGATVVVPGSHLSGKFTDRSLTLPEMKILTPKKGDVVFWDSRLWHGTTPNSEGSDRWALIATLTSWWVKQSMDMTRSLPQEIYRTLTNEEKRLLGFCSIPPRDEHERINTKCGFEFLKPNVSDYHK